MDNDEVMLMTKSDAVQFVSLVLFDIKSIFVHFMWLVYLRHLLVFFMIDAHKLRLFSRLMIQKKQ